MNLEQQIAQIPKTLLALIVITAVVVLMFLFNPPHSICDTQVENVSGNLKGIAFPTEQKKVTFPPRILKAKDDCRIGNTAGACYEYFSLLKTVAEQITRADPQCRAKVLDIKEVEVVMTGGIEAMALAAWGVVPPVSPAARFGWMQESELAAFCILRNAYTKAKGEEEWNNLRQKINKEFPDERPVGASLDTTPPRAYEKMSEQDIWMKSIFSVRCETIL